MHSSCNRIITLNYSRPYSRRHERALPIRSWSFDKFFREAISNPIKETELTEILEQIAQNTNQSGPARQEAQQLIQNASQRKELLDALIIWGSDWASCNWPTEGVTVEARHKQTRWRLFLNADLHTICLYEFVGKKWRDTVNRCFASPFTDYSFLMQKDYVPILLEGSEDNDTSGDADSDPEEGSYAKQWNSIRGKRARARKQLQPGETTASGGEYHGQMSGLPLLVNAEVRLHQAAYPDDTLYVVKADLRDFYASIPHDVLHSIIDTLVPSPVERDLLHRFLTPTIRYTNPEGETATAPVTCGVPLAFSLSASFADLLLRLLERYVRQEAPAVRFFRQVDDMFLLTSDPAQAVIAWQHLQAFCNACGLRVNEEKCGSVAIGELSELPSGLPNGPARWGMLELTASGDWLPHEPTITRHQVQTEQAVMHTSKSLLTMAQTYNAGVNYLLLMLALDCPLSPTHQTNARHAVSRFHEQFSGEGEGIVAKLSCLIRERFEPDTPMIPEAWLYWPVTAGGLGLKNPNVAVGQFTLAANDPKKSKRTVPKIPFQEDEANAWSRFYSKLMIQLIASEPEKTNMLEVMVNDFIQRGEEVSSGKQKGLTAYWRWVLYGYGPQIIQCFGTFRFLVSELVPLQLLEQQRLPDNGDLETNDMEDNTAF